MSSISRSRQTVKSGVDISCLLELTWKISQYLVLTDLQVNLFPFSYLHVKCPSIERGRSKNRGLKGGTARMVIFDLLDMWYLIFRGLLNLLIAKQDKYRPLHIFRVRLLFCNPGDSHRSLNRGKQRCVCVYVCKWGIRKLVFRQP